MRKIRSLVAFFYLVSAGGALADGVVASWGSNSKDQLGNSSAGASSSVPLEVDSSGALLGKTVIQSSAGRDHSCALTSEGLAYCWGSNAKGQLGDGTGGANNASSNIPVAVSTAGVLSGKTVTQISAGNQYTCATASDGGVYCWGDNTSGKLGDNSVDQRLVPVQVTASGALLGKTAVQVAASVAGDHTCARSSDGLVFCWGLGGNGQLGNNGATDSSVPVAVSTASPSALSGITVTQVAVGSNHSCALASAGTVACWGGNASGQLGDASTTQRNTPVAVTTASGALSGGKTVTEIGAGITDTCAVVSTGSVACWGNNASGQLGTGSAGSSSSTPVAVTTTSPSALANKTVSRVAVGSQHACALNNDGSIACWGLGSLGRLGNGAVSNSATPVLVSASAAPLLGEIPTFVSAGDAHAMALAPSGGPGSTLTTGSSALFKMMSLPCTPRGGQTVADVFGTGSSTNFTTSQYGVPNPSAGTGWIVIRRDATTNSYVNLSSTDTLSGDVGYWIKSFQTPKMGKLLVNCQNNTPSAAVTAAQGCVTGGVCRAIPVTIPAGATSRYNLVSNPFGFAIDWSKVRIRVDGSASTYTPSAANTANLVSNTIWIYNGTSYDSYSDGGASLGNLQYFSSFWVQVLPGAIGKTVELLIPKVATTNGAVVPAMATTSAAATSATPTTSGSVRPTALVAAPVPAKTISPQTTLASNGWYVRLKIDDFAKGWKQHSTLLGQVTGAKAGYDREDLPALAPMSSPYLQVVFPRATWTQNPGDYSTDFRAYTGRPVADEWTFDVRASEIGSVVRLRWEADPSILRRSVIVNKATRQIISPVDPKYATEGIPLTVTSTTMSFTWRLLR